LLPAQYGNSEAAAEYRWKVALAKAAAKDYQGNGRSHPPTTPKVFWLPGQAFDRQMGDHGTERDKAAFEYVLSQFPYSYYGGQRQLGLDVGNFNTLRQLTPEVVVPARSVLPAGSATLNSTSWVKTGCLDALASRISELYAANRGGAPLMV